MPEVLENLQKAAAAGLFQASDAQKLLQSSVKAIRDEAAEAPGNFRSITIVGICTKYYSPTDREWGL